ncbi:hypothetical protein [Vreelandella stevensii]|uniref:hypothetical protein n=1 Tax=Vreelandella stevensii TaxID=502821 RepID=UPI003748965A
MAKFRAEKVVASLPDVLAPDTVYYVRTGEGFDLYVSDATGAAAHPLNADAALGDIAAALDAINGEEV